LTSAPLDTLPIDETPLGETKISCQDVYPTRGCCDLHAVRIKHFLEDNVMIKNYGFV